MASLKLYSGSRRKLVLAFDVGTTYSGISYSILDPGQVPEIKGVTKFPGQEAFQGSSKVPTVIYYDQRGIVRAVGAETTDPSILERAKDEGWVRAEWFKLHLKNDLTRMGPTTMDGMSRVQPLPLNKTAITIMADYLRYLLKCARSCIEETQPNGPDLWKQVEPNADFVLSHPNGWGGMQQARMREAAVKAKLVDNGAAAQSRISFVTEGEASLHFALRYGLPSEATKSSNGVVVVDAGGGTIDISTYSQKSHSKTLKFEEIAPPECHFKGSIFVSFSAETFLRGFMDESDYFDDINSIVQCFDQTTKLRFKSPAYPQYIKFGSTRDNDAVCNIRYGQLKLEGADVAAFFEPSIACIIQAVRNQLNNAHKEFDYVVLVGGFAANDWLYKCVKDALTPLGYIVHRPDYHVNKAVADGAISHYLGRLVTSRVAKVTYGVFGSILYDKTNPEHKKRREESYIGPSGYRHVPAFFVLVAKNTQVEEKETVRKEIITDISNLDDLRSVKFSVACYRGKVRKSRDLVWQDDPDLFCPLCTIKLDLFHLAHTSNMTRLRGKERIYYSFDIEVVMQFGGVEMKAFCSWMEHGTKKRSEVQIIYME